jgi:hypothetical protein
MMYAIIITALLYAFAAGMFLVLLLVERTVDKALSEYLNDTIVALRKAYFSDGPQSDVVYIQDNAAAYCKMLNHVRIFQGKKTRFALGKLSELLMKTGYYDDMMEI